MAQTPNLVQGLIKPPFSLEGNTTNSTTSGLTGGLYKTGMSNQPTSQNPYGDMKTQYGGFTPPQVSVGGTGGALPAPKTQPSGGPAGGGLSMGAGTSGTGTGGGGVTQPNTQQQQSDIQNQITALQGKVNDAQKAGYGVDQPIQGLTQTGTNSVSGLVQPPPGGTINANTGNQNPYTVGSNLQSNIITGLANTPQNSPDVEAARQDVEKLKNDYGQKVANIKGSQFGLTEATGEQGILQQQYLTALDAAQTRYNTALQSQQLQQSALQSAGQLNQPITGVPYGTQSFYPGQLPSETAGGSLNPLNNVTSIAQQVISGKISPSQAYAMGGNVQNWQGMLNQEIQKQSSGFNTATAEGKYSAQQQVAQIGGTAGSQAAQQVFQQAYGTYNQLQNTTQNIDQFGNLLTQTMQQGGINPSNLKQANLTLAAVRNQLSSGQQAVYDNTLASLRSRVSGLLAAGGSEVPSAITSDAQKILDGSLPLSGLSSVLARIKQEGEVLLQNQAQIVNDNYKKLQGGGTTQNNSGGGNYNW